MQIRVKTAKRFYFGPVAIAKQVNITAISTAKLITHILQKEVYIRTPSSSFDAWQSLTVFIHIYSLAFVSFCPVSSNILPPITYAIEEEIEIDIPSYTTIYHVLLITTLKRDWNEIRGGNELATGGDAKGGTWQICDWSFDNSDWGSS